MNSQIPVSVWKMLKENHMFEDDFWNDMTRMLPNMGPKVDIYETGTEVVAVAELPGLKSFDQVKLTLKGRHLHMKGELEYDYPVEPELVNQSERFLGKFQRSVTLPADVIPAQVKANYVNGLLWVYMMKQPEQEMLPIEIHFHKED